MKTGAGVSSLWRSERAVPHKANAAFSCRVVPCLALSCHAAPSLFMPCCAEGSCVTIASSVYQREKESQLRHRSPWYCQVFPRSHECLAALSHPSHSHFSILEPFCLYPSPAPAEPALHPGAVQPALLPAGHHWRFGHSLEVAGL